MSLRSRLVGVKHNLYMLRRTNKQYKAFPARLVKGKEYTITSPDRENKNMRYLGLGKNSRFGDVVYSFSGIITREVEYYRGKEYGIKWEIIEELGK